MTLGPSPSNRGNPYRMRQIGQRLAEARAPRSDLTRHPVFTGPVVIALVNTADPTAGLQAAVTDPDT